MKTIAALLTITLLSVISSYSPAYARIVDATCNLTTNPVAFGNYDFLSSTPLDTTSALSFSCNCNKNAPTTQVVTTTISAGGSGSAAARQMTGPGTLNYNLYSDAGYGTIWDDVTGVNDTLVSPPANPPQPCGYNRTIYGRIPINQGTAPAGSYTDTVIVTVTW